MQVHSSADYSKIFALALFTILPLAYLNWGCSGNKAILTTVVSPSSTPTSWVPDTASVNYLVNIMDKDISSFVVFRDSGHYLNHFEHTAPYAGPTTTPNPYAVPTGTADPLDYICAAPHAGKDCIHVNWDLSDATTGNSNAWGGINFTNGRFDTHPTNQGGSGIGNYWSLANNYATGRNQGQNLTGATKLTFWAKGTTGNEQVKFSFGGGGYAGSTTPQTGSTSGADTLEAVYVNPVSPNYTALTTFWKKYTIDLAGKDLSYVTAGFGMSLSGGVKSEFYIDDIEIDLARSAELRMPKSWETDERVLSSHDMIMANVAWVYDSSLALIGILASGDTVHAKLIADSFVYAVNHDRFQPDGRVRSAYLPSNSSSQPGWLTTRHDGVLYNGVSYDYAPFAAQISYFTTLTNVVAGVETGNKYSEDAGMLNCRVGDMAWAALGLLAYHERVYGGAGTTSEYLTAVLKIANFVEAAMKDTTHSNKGYYFGIDAADTVSIADRKNKSGEHNFDLYPVFVRLYRLTGDAAWLARANWALDFVLTLWEPKDGKFFPGVNTDSVTTANSNVASDGQSWYLLSTGDLTHNGLAYAEQKMSVGVGYDFNFDQDGIWWEGTAQMAAAYRFVGNNAKANQILTDMRLNREADGGFYATLSGNVTTGFNLYNSTEPWVYQHQKHVGATSWYVIADEGINPYWYPGAP